MKRFPAKGMVHGTTYTVGDLRQLLAALPANMPVFARWEGVHAFVDAAEVTTTEKAGITVRALILDADNY